MQISGAAQVLEAVALLQELGQRSGQTEIPARIRFLLEAPYFGSKLPHLILHSGPDGQCEAAAIVLEHRIRRWTAGIFVPLDTEGDLTVIAPPGLRMHSAAQTATYLLQKGARLVLLSTSGLPSQADSFPGMAKPVSVQTRDLRRTLLLKATEDETLEQMGARTRRNLRHANRKVVQEFGAVFVDDVPVTEPELVALNRLCSYPVPDWVSELRHRQVRTLRGGFLSGLRASDGRWLSVIGGRRLSSMTVIDWQMNRADLGSVSIGAAMRHLQIRCEIARGTSLLQFTGGTPHTIQSAFLHEPVTDLLWTPARYRHPAFRNLASRLLPKSNLLKAVLAS